MHRRHVRGQVSLYALLSLLAVSSLTGFVALGHGFTRTLGTSTTATASATTPALGSRADAALFSQLSQITRRAQTWLSGQPRVGSPVATREVAIVEELHGVPVADPYRWLENANDPEVSRWLENQDTRTQHALRDLPGDRGIKRRLALDFDVDDTNQPLRYGQVHIASETKRGLDKRIYYLTDAEGHQRRVLFDPNTWSDDGTTELVDFEASPHGKLIAYRVSENGMDDSFLRLRNTETNQDLDETLLGLRDNVTWFPDEERFVYNHLPEAGVVSDELRPGERSLRIHHVGEAQAKDRTIFPAAKDPQRFLSGGVSEDGRWLQLSYGGGWTKNEHFLLDLHKSAPHLGEQPLAARSADAAQWVRDEAAARGFVGFTNDADGIANYVWSDGYFYIYTDWNAPNGRILRTTPDKLAADQWTEIVPTSGRTLEDFDIIDGRLVIKYLDDVTTRLEVRELDGTFVREQALPGLGTASFYKKPSDPGARLFYSSYDQPSTEYDWNVRSGELRETKRDVTHFDIDNMTVTREWATSKDGTKVPLFVLHRKDVKLDGSNPTWLTGYGGFSANVEPSFRRDAAQWVEAGGVFVEAVLRGGGEFGEPWHQAGKGANKQNVFDDAAAVAERLIERGYTSPANLAIEGGSNGGLLVGAMITQYPNLFCAGVCGVPLLDMVRYHLSGAGRTWVDEYGSAENATEFQTLLRYSPYHNIDSNEKLPALLMMTADSDDRVDPNHARKFTARYQTAVDDQTPVLLRVDKNAGHGGGATFASYYASVSDQLRFMAWQLGDRSFQRKLARSSWAQRRALAKNTLKTWSQRVTPRNER